MQEIWKPIPGYENLYEASIFGQIRSLDRITVTKSGIKRSIKGKLLKQIYSNKDPRPQVSLCKNFTVCIFRVHYLMMLTFVGERPEGLEICHNNGDTTNNCIGNLRYDTQSNNNKDKLLHGTQIRGSQVVGSKLNDNQIKLIREMYVLGISQQKIAIDFNVSRSHIGRIVNRQEWSWLT